VFPPGKALVTEIPIGALYDLHARGEYRVRVTGAIPGGTGDAQLVSNEVALRNA
jgi:hypothetical protein